MLIRFDKFKNVGPAEVSAIKNKQVTQSNGSGPGVLGHFCHGHFGHGRFGPDISATDISAIENAGGGRFGHNHKFWVGMYACI